MRTGMIEFSGLSHKRARQSDPRITWFMFHNIYRVYNGINNKEERNSAMLITIMSEYEEGNKSNEELKDSRDNDDKNQLILKNVHPF